MMTLPERIAARAVRVRPSVAIKTIVSLPFYILGWVVGAAWFVLTWVWAAAVIGFTDVAGRRRGAEG